MQIFLQIVESQIHADVKNNLGNVLRKMCSVAVTLDRLPIAYQAELYTYLSHKLQRFYLRLWRLVLTQSPKALNEVRDNIERISQTLKYSSLFSQMVARIRNSTRHST